MHNLKNIIITGTSILATAFFSQAYADGVLRGVPYPLPSHYQVEERIVYSENEKGTKTTTDTLFLKYRNEKMLFSVGFPYKYIDQQNNQSGGFGDASALLGLINKIEIGKNNLHLLPYCSLIFPTGDFEGNTPTGNGRFDEKLGIAATYLTESKRFELDAVLERVFTGENKKGTNPPEEYYLSVVGGGRITDRIRVVTGFAYSRKNNGDYSLGPRAAFRYTAPSKKWQVETFADRSIENKNISKGYNIGIIARRNLGR